MSADSDFTISEILAWARTKPAGETYDYLDNGNCAMCQFLRETGRIADPIVTPRRYGSVAGGRRLRLSEEINEAVQEGSRGLQDWTFGALVARLEALCPSEWAHPEAYMADIETVMS